MIEYGYIENGFLRSKIIEPYIERRLNAQNEVITRTVSIEEQIAMLSPEWKPVDAIDESKTICNEENYTIRIEPYDNGDRISYRYVKSVDNYKLRSDIDALKNELAATDYQVIKCYEASLTGEDLPYDIVALHASRNEIRARINEIQTTQINFTSL